MSHPEQIPADLFVERDFVDSLSAEDLVYFVCNVGDGDSQLLLLPEFDGRRSVIVVDSATKYKIPWLLDDLEAAGLVDPEDECPIALIVATHPHLDHIRGIPYLLDEWGGRACEFWDSGYFHPIGAFHDMMTALERIQGRILYAQPTSGLKRWIGNVALTALSPSIHLRNRYDTYGVDPNNASISLRVDYPASGVVQTEHGGRSYWSRTDGGALVLGADAQTLSWSYVLTDFPRLEKSHSAAARAIEAATHNVDLLRGQVLKVSHHGSKRGLNLELIERINPRFTLVSSCRGGGKHNFPHTLAQEIIREAIDPRAKKGGERKKDWELRIFYTCDEDTAERPLGSIAVVLGGRTHAVWRFGESSDQRIRLSSARRWRG